MKRLFLFVALLLAPSAFAADNAVIVTPGTGVTMRSIDVGGGVQSMGQSLVNSSGTNVIGAGITVPVSGTVAATESGTWNITNISGTVSLPTGAATAAKQPALGTAGSASTDVLTVQGIASMTPLLANPGTIATWGLVVSTQNSATPTNAHLIAGQFNTTPTTITTGNVSPLQMDNAGNLLVNIKAGAGSGGTAIADNAAFTQGTTNETPIGCFFTSGAYSAITTTHVGVAQCDSTGHLLVNVTSAVGLAQGSTTAAQTGSLVMGAVTTAAPTYTTAQTSPVSLDTHGGIRIGGAGYPAGATPETASATGTTAATTATLATSGSVTTYLCGFSIRANATAAATGNSTVTGTITGTLNYTQWTAPAASGIGLTEQIFVPCVPASAVNTGIAVISAAPGSGGVVSVTAWGFTL